MRSREVGKLISSFKQYFVYRFDPCHLFLKQAARTAISLILALVLFHYFTEAPERYWVVLAAAFIIQARVGKSGLASYFSIIVVGTVAAAVGCVMTSLHPSLLAIAVALGLLGVAFSFYSMKGHVKTVRGFFVFLFAIMSSGLPLSVSATLLDRGAFIVLGTLCALLASLLWPKNGGKEFKRLLKIYEHNVSELILLQLRSMLHDEKVFLKMIHERRNRLLRQFRMLQDLATTPELERSLRYADQIRVFAVSIGNLRYFSFENSNFIHSMYAQIFPLLKTFLLTSSHVRYFKTVSGNNCEIAGLYNTRLKKILLLKQVAS